MDHATKFTIFTGGLTSYGVPGVVGGAPIHATTQSMVQLVQLVKRRRKRGQRSALPSVSWCAARSSWCWRPHHPSPRSPVRSGRAARHLDGRRLQMRLRVTCNPVDPIIVGSPFVDFSWNSKNGISRETMSTPISLSITRRRCGMTYCWVVDWFDPRSGCRYEAVYSTLAEATRCRSEVLSELSR